MAGTNTYKATHRAQGNVGIGGNGAADEQPGDFDIGGRRVGCECIGFAGFGDGPIANQRWRADNRTGGHLDGGHRLDGGEQRHNHGGDFHGDIHFDCRRQRDDRRQYLGGTGATIAGNGTGAGNLTLNAGGLLSPGGAGGIRRITDTLSPSLGSSPTSNTKTLIEIDKSNLATNDQVFASGAIIYGGTLTV